MPGIRLLIADQRPIVLKGLMSVFAAQRDFEIVASCSSGTSCVEAIRNLAPDLALLEDSLPEVTAFEILAIANAENFRTRLVFFTASGVHRDLAAAIAAGACSEISKCASPETLLQSLRLAAEGISLLPEPPPGLVPTGKEVSGANTGNVLAGLTDREREIMRLVSEGLSNKEVARVLNISQGTIKVHLHNIYQKLEINNRTVLAAIALSQRYGGIGILTLTALIFSMIEQVRAADPDVTILDNDSIAYKDLEHGVFELVTKEAIPRHILVEDPAETIILGPRGSTISVNKVANSVARMEELQAAQQDVLANFAKGFGPGGSGTPPLVNSVPVQRINFIQTDVPAEQNSLPPLPALPGPVPEITIIHPPPPPPEPPTLTAVTGPIEIDTVTFDNFTATSGTFIAHSSNSGTLTFGISGGTAGSTVLDGVTYDVSKTGSYGTLYVNSTTGAYSFVPDSAAINALTTATTASFTVTVSDGTLSASQTFTVAINGVNDAAVISGTATGSVIEAGGAVPGMPTATGTLTDTDVDNPANTFTAVGPTASDAGYGSFTMTTAGVWVYKLDNANSAVQALNVGGTLTDTFTVTTIDGTTKLVTITITGSNDAAVISGTSTGSVIEAGVAAPGAPTATGTLTDTDTDNSLNTFVAISSPTLSAGGFGSFTMTAAGVWVYTLDNANSTVQALNVGGTLTDTFTVTTVDGTATLVTITIAGANDAAVISGTATGSVIEAGATPGTPTASGTLADTDVDNPANTFTAISSPTASAGGYGSFTMTAAGVWAYTLDNANSAVQALNVGGTLTDTFTVTTIDGTAKLVTVTITGSNDAAVISGTATGSVIEAGATPGTPTASGTLTDTDVDNPSNTFTAISSPTVSAGGYGSFTMTVAGVWAYTLDNDNSVVQALDVGDTLTDTFTVTTVDGTAKLVTITINGASDADPNDFDSLAPGPEVISDPPFVYGTPGGETIAGGGNEGQIIYAGAGSDTANGTGRDDIIYAGSGNDTVKGNDGDDTIYGGSGNDTINGNNGSDTIIGGFGADQLTGSNGNDRFVYLSVADSNASLFDIITDFASGSDKIDLTALGALAFLALTSTSTSVPPHTIAWIYDGTINQTIVYVNPTDQTLSIGSSSLLEIHLQGIVTVESSDFVFEAAAAPVALAGEPINLDLAAATADAAVFAMTSADGTVDQADAERQITNASFGFDTDRDRFDFGHVRFAKFDEARTQPTEETEDNAVIAPENGPLVVPHHVHVAEPAENKPASDPAPVLNSANTITAHDDPMMHASGNIHSAGIAGPDAPGDMAALQPGNHGLTVANSIAHSGGPPAHGGNHSSSGDAGEHGNAAAPGAPEPPSPAHGVGPAATGPPGHGDSFHFQHAIVDSGSSGIIEPPDIGHTPASIGHHAHAAGDGGPDQAQTIDLSPPGHSADHVPSQAGHTHVAHAPHDIMV